MPCLCVLCCTEASSRSPPRLARPPQYLPSVAERKAAFEEYCKEAGTSKKGGGGGGGSKFGGAGRAGSGAAAAAATRSPVAEFEDLLDEIREACLKGAGAAAGGEEGQLLAWESGLRLEALEARWGGDPRWAACRPAQRAAALDKRLAVLREEERRQAEAAYRALLKEHRVTASSRWSRTKDDLCADPRYLALSRDVRWAPRVACAAPLGLWHPRYLGAGWAAVRPCGRLVLASSAAAAAPAMFTSPSSP